MTECSCLTWVIIYGWKPFFPAAWFMLCGWEASMSPPSSRVLYPQDRGFPSLSLHFSFMTWSLFLRLLSRHAVSTGKLLYDLISAVPFCRSVVPDALRPHGPRRARPPRPSAPPGACASSRPSRRRCHPTIASSVVPLEFHLRVGFCFYILIIMYDGNTFFCDHGYYLWLDAAYF